MRRVLEPLGPPNHVGLAYDVWAPVGDDGSIDDAERQRWLSQLAGVAIAADYARAFDRWRASFRPPSDRTFELQLASRLLVGHGNTSAVDVGMTVHHTWGVPVIPGSAIKGLLAHFVDAVYGPETSELPPWEQAEAERERARYQGVTWRGPRIQRGPGEVYRRLFGAPDAEEDAAMRERGFTAGASAGLVVFHDALYVPKSTPDDKPFAADVLTVHQKAYYNSSGRSWPNDYDPPNPVSFLTVRPRARMLLALSGPPGWRELAERLLRDALDQWGVGAKTSAGYGRLVAMQDRRARVRGVPPKAKDRVEAVLLEERTKKGGWTARHEASGLAGPIQNSDKVPAGEKPGNTVTLTVAFANAKEIAFRFATEEKEARTAENKKKRK